MDPSIQSTQTPTETMQTNPDLVCDFCHTVNPSTFFFCPNCGKVLRQKPLSTSIFKQIWIYFIALFLPPLGLIPGIKYLRQKTYKENLVGLTSIILTVISIVVSIWLALISINKIQTMVNDSLQNSVQGNLETQLNNQLKNIQTGNDLGI